MAEWPADMDQHWQRSHAEREGAYEDQAVRFMLRRYGLQLGALAGAQKTFAGLCDQLGFPVWLVAKCLPFGDNATQLRLFKELALPLVREKNLLFSTFARAADEAEVDLHETAFGMVFALPVVTQFCVLHTVQHMGQEWHIARQYAGQHYYRMERLESLLTGLEWTPE